MNKKVNVIETPSLKVGSTFVNSKYRVLNEVYDGKRSKVYAVKSEKIKGSLRAVKIVTIQLLQQSN